MIFANYLGMSEPAQEWYDVYEPDLTHVVTEDDEPVDNLFSEKQQRLLVDSLYASGSELQPFLAMANVGLFFTAEQPPYVPDMLLSFGVQPPADLWEKRNRSYFIWVYGKPPELVVEVVSNRDRHEEAKIAGYARLGIGYYVIFDPQQRLSQRKLRVYELHGTTYVPVADPRTLTTLPLGVKLVNGVYEGVEAEWLRWVLPEGKVLLTGQELAEEERERADKESLRAEQERLRAERLAARLRELGLEAD